MLSFTYLVGLCAALTAASPTYEILDKRQQTSDQLYVVFSGNTFETIPPPDGGTTAVYQKGFSIFTGSGTSIYNGMSIDGYTPCFNMGNNISVSGACLGPDFNIIMSCVADSLGNPASCAAWANTLDDELDCQQAGENTYNDFITSGASSSCTLSFARSNNDLDIQIHQTADNPTPC